MFFSSILSGFVPGLWQGVVDENSNAYRSGKMYAVLFVAVAAIVIWNTWIRKYKK